MNTKPYLSQKTLINDTVELILQVQWIRYHFNKVLHGGTYAYS